MSSSTATTFRVMDMKAIALAETPAGTSPELLVVAFVIPPSPPPIPEPTRSSSYTTTSLPSEPERHKTTYRALCAEEAYNYVACSICIEGTCCEKINWPLSLGNQTPINDWATNCCRATICCFIGMPGCCTVHLLATTACVACYVGGAIKDQISSTSPTELMRTYGKFRESSNEEEKVKVGNTNTKAPKPPTMSRR